MKRVVFTLSLILSVYVASAQINRTIWDCIIGRTTIEQVLATMEAKGMPLTYHQGYDTYVYSANDSYDYFKFGGTTWDYVQFKFYKDVLYQITFASEVSADKISYDNLNNRLKEKYEKYLTLDFQGENIRSAKYKDKIRQFEIQIDLKDDILLLSYTYNYLRDKKIKSESDEL